MRTFELFLNEVFLGEFEEIDDAIDYAVSESIERGANPPDLWKCECRKDARGLRYYPEWINKELGLPFHINERI
jgi:hypothetical protein